MLTNSWIVTRRSTGEVIGEFYDPANVARFNPTTCLVETAYDYLVRLNRELKTDWYNWLPPSPRDH